MAKTLNQTYLYPLYPEYQKKMFEFIMTAEEIDTTSDEFEDVAYDVTKRQVGNNAVKVMNSSKVKLMLATKDNMQKSLKIFTAKNVKEDHQLTTYIDCSNIITKDKGMYRSSNIDMLVSYITAAMNFQVYYTPAYETKVTGHAKLTEIGARAFSNLFFHIIDIIAKISSVPGAKDKCRFLAAEYYQACLLEKDYMSNDTLAVSTKITQISNRDAAIILKNYDQDNFLNIKSFVEMISDSLKLPKLTIDTVISKWMYSYDPGTLFAMELYPYFAKMITDAYVGGYVNNQKTIQRIIDTDMNEFSKQLINLEESM